MAAFTAKQSDLYDRQIRLWGAESQNLLQSSKVLFLKPGKGLLHTAAFASFSPRPPLALNSIETASNPPAPFTPE